MSFIHSFILYYIYSTLIFEQVYQICSIKIRGEGWPFLLQHYTAIQADNMRLLQREIFSFILPCHVCRFKITLFVPREICHGHKGCHIVQKQVQSADIKWNQSTLPLFLHPPFVLSLEDSLTDMKDFLHLLRYKIAVVFWIQDMGGICDHFSLLKYSLVTIVLLEKQAQ